MSFLERCPQFRGVLIEGFHCIHFVCIYVFSHYTVCVGMAVAESSPQSGVNQLMQPSPKGFRTVGVVGVVTLL